MARVDGAINVIDAPLPAPRPTAMEDRGADAPHARIDFTVADGVALGANLLQFGFDRGAAGGVVVEYAVEYFGARLVGHERQQRFRRRARLERHGAAFFERAAQRVLAVDHLEAHHLMLDGDHQPNAFLRRARELLHFAAARFDEQRIDIEAERELQADRARRVMPRVFRDETPALEQARSAGTSVLCASPVTASRSFTDMALP